MEPAAVESVSRRMMAEAVSREAFDERRDKRSSEIHVNLFQLFRQNNEDIPARIPASRIMVYVSRSLKDKAISPAVFLNASTVGWGSELCVTAGLRLTGVPNRALLNKKPRELWLLHISSCVQRRDPFFFILIPEWCAIVYDRFDSFERPIRQNSVDEMFSYDRQGVHSFVHIHHRLG